MITLQGMEIPFAKAGIVNEPRFLTIEQVGRLHQKTIERFGGLHGIHIGHTV